MNRISLIALLFVVNCDGFTLLRPSSTRGVVPSSFREGIRKSSSDDNNSELLPTQDVVKRVAVTGATGKTGLLVVEELLNRNVEVVGLVRNQSKAEEIFSSFNNTMLQIKPCNLTDPIDVETKITGCDALIWCATGFADSPNNKNKAKSSESPSPPASGSSFDIRNIPIISKIIDTITGSSKVDGPKDNDTIKKSEPPAQPTAEQSIDIVGIPIVAKVIMEQQRNVQNRASSASEKIPKVVMLSSAGITRPSWDENKKERLKGCADIPIVRLNPFGILDIKAESEKKLRKVNEDGENLVDYCIVRPCGLNDDWPQGARPIFSQGDVAVGRINRNDVAKILCDVLSIPEACYKTFEVIGLAGYPSQKNIGPALSQLKYDTDGISESEVDAMYNMAQQLLPGERQNPAALAMGQTYEQFDRGETGRLGERGKEDAESAAPKPTTTTNV